MSVRKWRAALSAALCMSIGLGVAACGSSGTMGTSAGAGGSKSPIVIGFISDLTGSLSSSYLNSEWGAEARIDALNAAGGVGGRKVKLLIQDDQSVPAGNQTAAEYLVGQKSAFGVIDDSALTFNAAAYLQRQGVPVTGAAIDGPEWGEKPNSNMFSVTVPSYTPVDGRYYSYTDEANFLKDIGVTKFAGMTYDLESAEQSLSSLFQTASSVGIKTCYKNTTYQFGSVNFSPAALAVKAKGCNGGTFVGLLANAVGLSDSLKQAGVKTKQLYAETAYDQNLLDNPAALNSMQGDYTSALVDIGHPNAATQTMLSRLKQYTGFKVGIPNLNVIYGYAAADLMIKGLEMAGPDATRASFISNLRKVGNYTAGGLFAGNPVTFKDFGTVGMFPPTACMVFEQVQGKGYVPYDNDKPVCGKRVATH